MAQRRQPDVIELVTATEGSFRNFERLEVVNAIDSPTQATFEFGDDGSYQDLRELLTPGEEVRVTLNGLPRFKGRAEVFESPVAADGGVRVRVTARPKTSDARYRSADPKLSVENVTLKEFIQKAYAGVGLGDAFNFVFAPGIARDLMTGRTSRGSPPDPEVEQAKLDQAKVQPPETIHELVERHLKRFGATHWDAPDGRIVVGKPDDDQPPIARLICKRDRAAAAANNVLDVTASRDWSEVAREVRVFGATAGKDLLKSSVSASAVDDEVDDVFRSRGHFNRTVLIPSQQAKDKGQAALQAQRELTARRKRQDAIEATVDGWSYWSGSYQVPWTPDTTVDVDLDVLGGVRGRYLLHRTVFSLSASGATTTRLALLRAGLWVL